MPVPKYDENRNQWTMLVWLWINGEKKQKRFSAQTKKSCNEKYLDFMKDYSPSYQVKDESSMTVAELCREYLASNKQRWKVSSYYDIENRMKHITDTLGNKDARKLTAYDVQMWQNGLENYSFKYRKTLRSQLSSVLRYAERIHDIPNVMLKVDNLRNMETRVIEYWTPEEFGKFIESCDDEYRLFFRVLYISGCRKGEAMALTNKDIFDDHIHICKSITSKGSDGGWMVTTPKNLNSVRDVDMPIEIMDELKKIKTEYVFGGDRPYPLRTLDRVWEKGIENAGVKKIKIHDLRHSCASLLISRGASIVAVAKRLGHKDTEMTLNTYSHFMVTEKDKVISAFKGI